MLAPETLKPYLLDEDPHVRRVVAEYFGDGRFQDPTLIPLIFDACDQYGVEANTLVLSHARHLPVNEHALDRVLATLHGPCPAQPRLRRAVHPASYRRGGAGKLALTRGLRN